MRDSGSLYFALLEQLYRKAPSLKYTGNDNIVIFSDLHMGDGRLSDDFAQNSELFLGALKDYYYPEGYILILNGDVEETLKFNVYKIEKRWEAIYRVFLLFEKEGRLYKIIGNHDPRVLFPKHNKYSFPLHDALRLFIEGKEFFIYHGHQSSYYYDIFSDLMTFSLRYFASPLGVRNYSRSYRSKKRSHVEKMAYDFAKKKKIISIIGHTHRPLFESLSKMDTLKYTMEYYLRKYQGADSDERKEIEKRVKTCSEKIKEHQAAGEKEHTIHSIYSDTIILPCVFNSGAVMGKRGMTSLEITGGSIYLVHWFDKGVNPKYLDKSSRFYMHLSGSDITRYILKHDSLDYLYAKIQMLS